MTLFLLVAMTGQSKGKGEFTVLQWNVWQEGTMVPGGYDAIVNEIVRLQPDFVTFSEVRNYHNTRFNERIVASLKEKGLDYYSFYTYDTGLLRVSIRSQTRSLYSPKTETTEVSTG